VASIRVTTCVDSVDGTLLFEAVVDGELAPGPRVAVVGWTHGNEPVGGAVLDHLERVIEHELIAGSVLAIRANLVAREVELRHTADGVDLNRLYDAVTLRRLRSCDPASLCYEERRALEIAPLLLGCDAVLDIHSTSRPTEAFLLFRDDQAHGRMARILQVPNLVTGLHQNGILQGGLAANVGLEAAERATRLGFTFEAGQHEDSGNMDRAWDVTHRLFYELGVWSTAPPESSVQGRVFEVQ